MRNIIKFRFAGIGIMLVMVAVFGAIVMLLWNALLPELFTMPALNYQQAVGLLLLARILFGGLFGGQGYSHAAHGGLRGGPGFHQHGNKLREKWMNMSEDERKEFLSKEKDFLKFNTRFSNFHPFFDNDKESKKETENE